jgi:hypothetical protein
MAAEENENTERHEPSRGAQPRNPPTTKEESQVQQRRSSYQKKEKMLHPRTSWNLKYRSLAAVHLSTNGAHTNLDLTKPGKNVDGLRSLCTDYQFSGHFPVRQNLSWNPLRKPVDRLLDQRIDRQQGYSFERRQPRLMLPHERDLTIMDQDSHRIADDPRAFTAADRHVASIIQLQRTTLLFGMAPHRSVTPTNQYIARAKIEHRRISTNKAFHVFIASHRRTGKTKTNTIPPQSRLVLLNSYIGFLDQTRQRSKAFRYLQSGCGERRAPLESEPLTRRQICSAPPDSRHLDSYYRRRRIQLLPSLPWVRETARYFRCHLGLGKVSVLVLHVIYAT